jgi:fluoroacetyl-CoA thioesterase
LLRLTLKLHGSGISGELASMKPIPNGAQGQYVLRVESAHLANRFKDSILPPVFSTPYLILIMENAALNAIKQYLEAGESAVGTRVDVRHLVATPVGREVVGHAEVTGMDGRRIFFRVWAMDGKEEIGSGAHERMVVSTARIIERMTAKYGPTSEGD